MEYKSGLGWYLDMVRVEAEEHLKAGEITENEYIQTLHQLGSVEALLNRPSPTAQTTGDKHYLNTYNAASK